MGLSLRHVAKGQVCQDPAPAAGHLQPPTTPAPGNPVPSLDSRAAPSGIHIYTQARIHSHRIKMKTINKNILKNTQKTIFLLNDQSK